MVYLIIPRFYFLRNCFLKNHLKDQEELLDLFKSKEAS